jgi:hypothetical protein
MVAVDLTNITDILRLPIDQKPLIIKENST